MKRVTPLVGLLAVLLLSNMASADAPTSPAPTPPAPAPPPPAPPPPDAQLARLIAAKASLKWNWVPPGKNSRYGHAEVLIDAPVEKVRAHVTDYAKYRELAPKKFKTARVVAKQGDSTDVYFRIPILKGLGTLSYVLRFGPPQKAGFVETIEGKVVTGTGNVRDVHLAFTLRPVEGNRTILTTDLLVVPSFPAPQDALDEELRDAAQNAVDALNDQSRL